MPTNASSMGSRTSTCRGVNLHTWAAEQFRAAIGFRLARVLVSTRAPRPQARAPWPPSACRAAPVLGARAPRSGARLARGERQRRDATHAAAAVGCVRDDGPWGGKPVDQVRVLYPGGWQTYPRHRRKGEWVLHGRPHDPGSYPVRSVLRAARGLYGRARADDRSRVSQCEALGSQSDQDSSCTAARCRSLPSSARTTSHRS